jgi:hypothetical protein
MSQTFAQRMNSGPKQKRERFQQLTQTESENGKAFAADLRKSKIHLTVKKLTACRPSRKILARPSDRRAPQKMNEPTEVKLGCAPWYTQNASGSRTFGSTTTTARFSALA